MKRIPSTKKQKKALIIENKLFKIANKKQLFIFNKFKRDLIKGNEIKVKALERFIDPRQKKF